MQSPFSFIVRPVKGRRYDNIKEIGGIDFITSSSKKITQSLIVLEKLYLYLLIIPETLK
mgnify:CR=1 FL=1